jgi:zinc/manganese transport system substrate-binding protein
MLRRLILALALLAPTSAHALNIFACEPEWGALASELAGNDAQIFVATNALQDPHQVQARPALIARLRGADLVVCTGAELEVGWMPVLLRQAANPRVQPGQPGYFEATRFVTMRDIPTKLDRADGDVHAAGNPHIQGDPRNLRAVAVALGARLSQVDPGQAQAYTQRQQAFLIKLDAAIARWQVQAAPLKSVKVVVHHKDWTYLLDWLGMEEVGTIEPKPGVPPGSASLAQLLDAMGRNGARLILYAAYQEKRPAEFISSKSGVPAVMLPFTVGGTEAAKDLIAFYDDTITRLLAAARKPPG